MKRHASMNRIYRLVWSHVHNAWIAVSELARGRGKSVSRRVVVVAAALSANVALGAPAGGQVTAGSGSISQSGSTTTVNQSSQNLSLNWQSFNTTAQETVNFVQPSTSAIAVNRIADTNGTQFLGHLNANGQVFLINPNGVLFGAGSQINVGGLVASTLDIDEATLNSGSLHFNGTGTGQIINQGTINAASGGYVAFVGNTVRNEGTVVAPQGTVALGAGSAATLTFAGNRLVQLQVDQNTLNNLAENGGLIQADGGMVLLTAGGKNALLASVVNNSGIIEARSVQNVNGTIVLDGGSLGAVSNSGTLDASGKNAGESGGTVKVLGDQIDLLAGSHIDVSGDQGGGTALVGGNFQGRGPEQNASVTTVAANTTINADAITNGNGGLAVIWSNDHTIFNGSITAKGGADGGNGGQVETSGHKLEIGNSAQVNTLAPLGTAGNWLLDPNDFNIAASGGDIDGTTLGNALSVTNVTIETTATTASCSGVACAPGTAGNGDILVNDVVVWGSNNTLTLSAYRDIVFDAAGNGLLDANTSTSGSIILRTDNSATGTGTVNFGTLGYVLAGTAGTVTIYYTSTNYAPTNFTGAVLQGTLQSYMAINVSATVANKTYDGTTNASVSGVTVLGSAPDGSSAGQQVSVSTVGATAAFNDKNAGTGKTTTISGVTLSGADAGLYYLNGLTSKTADISKANLSVTGVSASNKTYDATTAATLTGTAAVTVLGSDVVSVSGTGTGTFADKNVGNNKAVTVTGYTLSGADAGNYNIVQPTGVTANITKADLTVTGITASDKTYDTTTAATLSGTAAVTVLGSDAVTVSGTGSGTFADKNVGNGKAVTVTGYTLSGADAGNYNVVQPTGVTANITKANLTVTGITASNKTYDGTTAATLGGVAAVSVLGSDTVSVSGTGSGTFADKNAGNGKSVTVTGYTLSGADAGNYNVVQPTGVTANIDKATLTVSGMTANNKTYDATTAATLSGGTLSGFIGTETVTMSGGSGNFADKNVGNGKTVTVTGLTLADGTNGGLASNYQVTNPTGVTANITKADLTVTGITASNKTYDTTTAATLSGIAAVTALGGDAVTVSGTGSGTFADKNVGNGKSVTVTGYTLSGTDAGNYNVVQPTGVTANITKANLTVTGITASNKTYDGTTTATLGGTAAVSALPGDAVSVSGTGSGTFADKNAGNGKTVTVTGYTLSGADAGNYNVVQPTGVTADIGKASITVSGLTASNKTYDGTTAATANTAGAVFTGLIGADVVTVNATGTFANKNVGNGKTVTLSSTYGGADAGNYTFTDQASTTANITAKAVTVSGITAGNKVYDATTAATITTSGAVFTGLVGGDNVTVSTTGTFANKNVANGKTVTLASTYGGTDAGNYTFTDQASTTANITPATLTLGGITAVDKTYDGTTAATLNAAGVTFTGLHGSDAVTLSGTGVGTFADKNAGNGKVVTVSGYTLGGVDGGNYTVGQPTGLTANIGKATLTVSGMTANNKTYDATTAATLSGGTLSGLIGTETVTMSGGSGTFADKNVGNGKTVTVTGITLADGTNGGLASNYQVTNPTGVTANITKANLTVTGVSASNKTYDATTAATLGGTATVAALGSDVVSVSGTGSGTFADKNVGNGKSVTVTGYTLSGTDAGNYNIVQPTGVAANITKANLTVSGVTASNKTYDGTTTATLGGTAAVSALGSDAVSVSGTGSGAFADKNAGNGKTVTVTGYTLAGADAGNYNVVQPTGVTANINKAALTVSGATAADKVYDGTTTAAINTAGVSLTGLVGGDVVSVSNVGNFADKNVGNGKSVGVTLSGADAANYTASQAGLTGNITPAALTVTANDHQTTANGRPYSGGNGVTYSGFVNGETASVLSGTLNYGGTSQGAIDAGSYTISASGLSSSNYALTYVDGILTVAQGAPTTSTATTSAINSATQVIHANLLPVVNPSPTLVVINSVSNSPATNGAPTTVQGMQTQANDATPPTEEEQREDADKIAAAASATRILVGSTAMNLQVVDGGIRLPQQMGGNRADGNGGRGHNRNEDNRL